MSVEEAVRLTIADAKAEMHEWQFIVRRLEHLYPQQDYVI